MNQEPLHLHFVEQSPDIIHTIREEIAKEIMSFKKRGRGKQRPQTLSPQKRAADHAMPDSNQQVFLDKRDF